MHPCRVCGNEENNSAFLLQEMMFGFRDKFNYFQCAGCGCLQIEEVPTDISKYYPPNYYSFNHVSPDAFLKNRLRRVRNRFAVFDKGVIGRLLYRLRPPPDTSMRSLARVAKTPDMRILDVGCGAGLLLCWLKELGFNNLMGVDPLIPDDIDYGNGLKILRKELADVGGKWDLVMFHHSFEHILGQLGTLQAAKALLNEDGLCLIRIPTVSSFAWRHYGVNWTQLDAPRHFYIHSLQSMSLLAKQAGFLVEKIVYDSEGFQFWGSELHAKGISLLDPNTGKTNPKTLIFSPRELQDYSAKADKLNVDNNGDQAAFYLRKVA
jgi:SAM-dependent methyltransferase